MSDKLTHKLNELTMLIDRDANIILRTNFAINYSEFLVLLGVLSLPTPSQKHLVHFTNLSKGMISRIVSKLTNQALLSISQEEQDRRTDVVALTTKGKKTIINASKHLEETFISEVLSIIPQKEIAAFERTLDKFLKGYSDRT
jgi:DNA-binding MarR family transcriptional regulator